MESVLGLFCHLEIVLSSGVGAAQPVFCEMLVRKAAVSEYWRGPTAAADGLPAARGLLPALSTPLFALPPQFQNESRVEWSPISAALTVLYAARSLTLKQRENKPICRNIITQCTQSSHLDNTNLDLQCYKEKSVQFLFYHGRIVILRKILCGFREFLTMSVTCIIVECHVF